MAKVKTFFVSTQAKYKFANSIESGRKHWERISKRLKGIVPFDFETNGLDAYKNQPLLLAFGDAHEQIVIDCHSVHPKDILGTDLFLGLAHNAKFDYKFMKVHYPEIKFDTLWCTLVAEQKLFQNTSRKMGLLSTVRRYLKSVPRQMDKSVRNTFIGADPRYVTYTQEQIEYAAADVAVLYDLYKQQHDMSDERGILDWFLKVEMPLIKTLGDCELLGFELDVPKFREVINDNKVLREKTAIELDNEFRRLRDTLLTEEESKYLRGGVYDSIRKEKPKPKLVGLFGEMDEYAYYHNNKASGVKTDKRARSVKQDENINKINWNSSQQLIEIFAHLKQPVPCVGEAGKKYGYLSPLVKNGRVYYSMGYTREGKLVEVPNWDESQEGFSVGRKAFGKYFIDVPNSPMKKFVTLLQTYSKANHEINSFGENFINYINPKTNRIHTLFRQARAVNGRLQSGGGKLDKDKINFQNIPRDAKFRHCFKGGGNYSVITCDLSGAEVSFMCDMAQDEKLHEWAVVNDDSHSPMVQNVWRHIFLYRAGIAVKLWYNCKDFIRMHIKKSIMDELEKRCQTNNEGAKWLELSRTFIVSKKVNKPYRQAGKNGTFGGVYGMKAAKAAETFNGTDVELSKVDPNFEPVNVTLEEGKVILFAQKRAIPKTYKMVEDNVRKAMSTGYLILNDRSKSRIWFEEVINLHKIIYNEYDSPVDIYYTGRGKYDVYLDGGKVDEYELNWKDVKDYDGQARNIPISGTQADCLKEAMVVIDEYIQENGLDCALLSQVHDELVYRCPKNMDGESEEWRTNARTVTFTFDEPINVNKLKEINAKHNGHIDVSQYVSLDDNFNTKTIKCSFALFVALTMIKCANRFMKSVKMQAEFDVMDSWTK